MSMHLGSSHRSMSEINVTPMVDVMLVLLIIFMVTVPLIQQGVPVDLPTTRAETLDVAEDRVILTITRDQRIYLGKAELAYAMLSEKLLANLRLQRQKEIYLHADRTVPYGFVVDVMAIVKNAGIQHLAMVTDPVQGTPE